MLLNVSLYLSSMHNVSQVHLKLAAVICAAKQSIFVVTFLGPCLLLLWAARLCLPTPAHFLLWTISKNNSVFEML